MSLALHINQYKHELLIYKHIQSTVKTLGKNVVFSKSSCHNILIYDLYMKSRYLSHTLHFQYQGCFLGKWAGYWAVESLPYLCEIHRTSCN